MTKKILVFGDSIAWGAFDTELGGWVQRLKLFGFGNNFNVYDFSVSSNDSKGILFSLEEDINKIKRIEPAEEYAFIFAIGTNDAAYFNNKENKTTSKEEFKSNLKKVIEISKKYTKEIIFVSIAGADYSKTQPIPWTQGIYYTEKDFKEYNQIIEEVCKEKNTIYLSVYGILENSDFEDGLHPNSKGHEKIFQKIITLF